jgi:hypothetical protein
LFGRSLGAENASIFRFPTISKVHFYTDVAFINVIIEFSKMEKIHSDHMVTDFPVFIERKKERKKIVFCHIFLSLLSTTFLSTFLFTQWGLASALNVLYTITTDV